MYKRSLEGKSIVVLGASGGLGESYTKAAGCYAIRLSINKCGVLLDIVMYYSK